MEANDRVTVKIWYISSCSVSFFFFENDKVCRHCGTRKILLRLSVGGEKVHLMKFSWLTFTPSVCLSVCLSVYISVCLFLDIFLYLWISIPQCPWAKIFPSQWKYVTMNKFFVAAIWMISYSKPHLHIIILPGTDELITSHKRST